MELAMLSGEGRVFRGNTMVGGVPVNMPAWGDSLVVALGRDQEVRVKRSMLQDESGTRRWSGKTVVTKCAESRFSTTSRTACWWTCRRPF